MGLSSPNIPNANFASISKNQYNYVRDLYNKINFRVDKLIIDYDKLDANTVDDIRKCIVKVSRNYSYPHVTEPSVKEELEKIFTLNMSSKVEIDFEKLRETIEGGDYALILYEYLQVVLYDRKHKLYQAMLQNVVI